MQFIQLVKVNILMLVRNRSGLFWTLVMPAGIYTAVSILPIGAILGTRNYSEFLLPGIIALTIMQSGIYTLAYWATDLRGKGVLKQLSVTPLSKSDMVVSLVLARSLIMVLQAALLTLVGMLFFGINIHGYAGWITLFVIMGGFVFLPIGLIISTFAKSYDAAAPITAAIGLPLTFLGNVFYPVELLPGYLQIIGRHLPITYLADGLRQAYLGKPVFADLAYDIYWLAGWIVIMLFLALSRFKIEE